ncbi:MAG TPA: hypothetical protein VGD56_13825, partial [Gemmatirosa sp.]
MTTRRSRHALRLALTGACVFLLGAAALSSGSPESTEHFAPPPDSATVRRAADLVRRARDADRAAVALDSAATATLADSARRTYLAAAALVPDVADWLTLRAAGVTADAGQRAALVRALAVPAARERAPLVDALARARGGDLVGAAAALDAISRPAQALGVRLRAASDPGARRAVRDALLGVLGSGGDTTMALGAVAPAPGLAETPRERTRTAAVLLDSAFA